MLIQETRYKKVKNQKAKVKNSSKKSKVIPNFVIFIIIIQKSKIKSQKSK